MAGDWIKFETTTPDKPEIFAIAEQLQLDPDAVVGKILRVWIWADSQTENGRLPVRKLSASQTDICHATVLHRIVDRLVGAPGFAAAMEAVGWLDQDGSLPRFERHNGKSAKKRALDLQRKRAERSPSVPDLSTSKADKNRTRDREERRDKDSPSERGGRPPSQAKPESRKSDPVFEAIASACGIDQGALTKNERGALNNAAGQLREINATPDDIQARAAKYRQKWPGIDLTPMALVNNWNTVIAVPDQAACEIPQTKAPPHMPQPEYERLDRRGKLEAWTQWGELWEQRRREANAARA